MHCAARWFRATFALVIVLAPVPCLAETTGAIVRDSAYAQVLRTINPRLANGESRVYATALVADSVRMRLDPRLVMAVVTVESGWNARAISPAGAEGLGQFTPETARTLGIDAWSGRSNLRGVTLYLHRLLGMFSSSRNAMREALASYNVGPYTIKSNGGVAPRGALHYVAKVLATFHAFESRLSAQPTGAVATALAPPDAAQSVAQDEAAYWGVR